MWALFDPKSQKPSSTRIVSHYYSRFSVQQVHHIRTLSTKTLLVLKLDFETGHLYKSSLLGRSHDRPLPFQLLPHNLKPSQSSLECISKDLETCYLPTQLSCALLCRGVTFRQTQSESSHTNKTYKYVQYFTRSSFFATFQTTSFVTGLPTFALEPATYFCESCAEIFTGQKSKTRSEMDKNQIIA